MTDNRKLAIKRLLPINKSACLMFINRLGNKKICAEKFIFMVKFCLFSQTKQIWDHIGLSPKFIIYYFLKCLLKGQNKK